MKKRERKIISAMIKAVKRGHAFTLHDTDGEPQALVLPWSDWTALNAKLVELEQRYVAPGARHLSDPNERIEIKPCTCQRTGLPREGCTTWRCMDEVNARAPIPEDQWGQGDVAPTGHVSETECDDNDCQLHETYRRYAQHLEGEKATVLPPKVFTNAPNAIMATEADEAEVQKRYGMTTEALADEAERGYDPARMKRILADGTTPEAHRGHGCSVDPDKAQDDVDDATEMPFHAPSWRVGGPT